MYRDQQQPTHTIPAGHSARPRQSQPLAPGTRLGHYHVAERLGAGGMGWVYKATDENLRRTVAIKVLAPGEITDEQRKRFAREAQSASALNHPNIVTVYEVGRENDIDYIAMECVAGETLRDLIGSKGVDPLSALRWASQIADALASAHEAGIVHRDLKPGNVMVTERGLVKVLDFGLAKHARAAHVEADGKSETTLSDLGHVIGTVSYMSPEQAEGKHVDTRSDIFAFGAVLFEMLTGQRAFEEGSHIGTLAAILKNDPPLRDLPKTLPHGFERVIERCLAKRPADRWQNISDVKLQIDGLIKDIESPPPVTSAPGSAVRRFGWPAMVGACVVAAGLSAVAYRLAWTLPAAESPPEPILRMLTADTGLTSYPAVSADGKLLAFASDRSKEGSLDIWLQQIAGRDLIRLTRDPSDEIAPAFSPDGTRIAFRSERDGGGVYVVSTLGGENPVLLAPGGRDPRFSPDGKWIAYWTGRGSQYAPNLSHLFVVESGGGVPRPVHPEMLGAYLPVWSPRGDELLVVGQTGEGFDWYVLPIDNNSPVRKTGALPLLRTKGLASSQIPHYFRPTPGEWTDTNGDRILFTSASGDIANLWEIDLHTSGVVRGEPRRITRGPGRQVRAARSATAQPASTVFADEELNFDIWAMAIDEKSGVSRGEPRRLTEEHSPEWAPSLSSDGRYLVFISRRGSTWMLRARDLSSGLDNTIIASSTPLLNAQITGDGSRVVYSNTDYGLFSVSRTGGSVAKLCERCGTVMGVSPDGGMATYEPVQDEDLLVVDAKLGTTRKLAERQDKGVILSSSRFSPDGKWIAFHSQHSPAGSTHLWIAPIHDTHAAPREEWISLSDREPRDRDPNWGADGTLIYFLSDRDGFRCIWARRLDNKSKKPVGSAFAVRHFHSARQSLQHLGYLTGPHLGGDQLVFTLGELTANIWSLETPPAK